MFKYIFILLFFISFPSFSQIEITWETLSDVRFTRKYFEEVGQYLYYPHFGESVVDLEGKEVYLQGFILPMDPENELYILSRYPFAACFFCGGSGPESIVEIRFNPGYPKFEMDQLVTIKGTLRLNQDDIYLCNYIFDRAEVYDP